MRAKIWAEIDRNGRQVRLRHFCAPSGTLILPEQSVQAGQAKTSRNRQCVRANQGQVIIKSFLSSQLQFNALWVSQNQSLDVSPEEFYRDVVVEVKDIVRDVIFFVEVSGKRLFWL